MTSTANGTTPSLPHNIPIDVLVSRQALRHRRRPDVRLSCRQQKRQRIAECVDQGVDLGAQIAPATSDRLILVFFQRAGAVLMRPNDRAVDHRVFVIGIGGQMLEDLLPDAGLASAAERLGDWKNTHRRFRQITPRNSGAVAIDHQLDEATVVFGSYADMALPARKQVLDPFRAVHTASLVSRLPRTTFHGSYKFLS